METSSLTALPLIDESTLEPVPLLKQVAQAHRFLAELKGVAQTIPNEGILLSSLTLQEAKDSSAIVNIITTHDQLFKGDLLQEMNINPAAREVRNYNKTLREGYKKLSRMG